MDTPHTEELRFDEILTLAERESGASGTIDTALIARARAMVERFNARGPYAQWRIEPMRRQVLRMLVGSLRIALDRRRYPQIAEVKIERPIFIVGFPRSGTTLLHSLLAEDPEVLKLQSWHVYSPSPPPGAGPVCQGRIAEAQRRVEEWMDFCPAQRSMHPYIDKGAYHLCEDEEAFSLGFHGAYPYQFFRVPTLEPADVTPSDPAAAYASLKELMQHLQWNTGKSRWICKEPGAQMRLGALFEAFPDALCVWAHRPLGEIYASIVALRAANYDTIAGRPRDWTTQPQEQARAMKAAFDRLIADEMIDDPRVLHLSFSELAADPLAVVSRIHARLDQTVSPQFALGIEAWLADPENAVDRYGRYPYSCEAFGLDQAWVDDLFADYSRRFGLV